MQRNILCSLHGMPFSLYCDRCAEPVCQKCTVVGPHHTSIHSLSQMPQAYERRVQELSVRLAGLTERNRDRVLDRITKEVEQIELAKVQALRIHAEHSKFKARFISRLTKEYENGLSHLNSESENISHFLHIVNDLGHEFETISTPNNQQEPSGEAPAAGADISCLVNFDRIIEELKQTLDQLDILLSKGIAIHQLPKQMTAMRLQLREIEDHEEMYRIKISILKEVLKRFHSEIAQIKAPVIDYSEMLEKIEEALAQFDEGSEKKQLLDGSSLRKMHYVCHFCGVILENNSINSSCSKNQMSEFLRATEDQCSFCKPGEKPNAINQSGYCKNIPDIVKFGTHRHHFGQPLNPTSFYKVAYINQLAGLPSLRFLLSSLPQAEEKLQVVNQNLTSEQNSFSNYLQILFYKIKTICQIKGKNLRPLFQKEDVNTAHRTGFCDAVAMEYILSEIVGLRENQCRILLDITHIQRPQDIQAEDARNYEKLLFKLDFIQIK